MASESGSNAMDMVKIYIITMAVLSGLCLAWLIYNYIQLSTYKLKLKQGEGHLEKILALEQQLPPASEQTQPKDIQDVYQFFKSTVSRVPEPEVEQGQWETGSSGGVQYAEMRYIIRFDNIDRESLTRYIHTILQIKPFLKLKQMELQKIESSKPYEESWKSELVFAYRELREKD